MPCKYFAANGKPSILFDKLYQHYLSEYSQDSDRAEKQAVRVWLRTRGQDFKKWFGDWEQPGMQDMSGLGALEGEQLGVERGSIGVNKQQLMRLLGASMYSKPLGQVAMKELLQNSFDAVKAQSNITAGRQDLSDETTQKALALIKNWENKITDLKRIKGYDVSERIAELTNKIIEYRQTLKEYTDLSDDKPPGNIEIKVNQKERTISFKDDGIGMTPDIVKNAFLSIGGTNKEGLSAGERSGGLGLAKVQFLMGSESVKVRTVRDGVKTEITATGVQLYNDDFNIHTSNTKEPNGSFVEIKIPKSYTTMEGLEREIDFPRTWHSEQWKAFDILNKPLIGNVNVTLEHTEAYGTKKNYTIPIGINSTTETLPPLFTNIKFNWGEADLYMSHEKVDQPTHRILSAGIYQFEYSFDMKLWEKIPYNIVVNIKPSVPSGSEQYPFNNQREGFKGTVSEDISALAIYLKQYAIGESNKEAAEVFSDIKALPIVDPSKILTPEEREKIYADLDATVAENKKRRIEQGKLSAEEEHAARINITGGKVINRDNNKVLATTTTEKEFKSSFNADKKITDAEPIKTEFFNPSYPQFHNNTNVDYLAIPGAVEFFTDFGNVALQLVRLAGDELSSDYKKLATGAEEKFFVGVSIDRSYGGVHISKIINAIFVNPLSFDPKNLEHAVGLAMHMTLHEINHTTASEEGAGFTTDFAHLYGKIYGTGKYGLFEGLFRSVYKKHFDTFKILKNEYDKSTTKNLSKSLSGQDKIQRLDTGLLPGDEEQVRGRQASQEGHQGDRPHTATDRLGDVILSNLKNHLVPESSAPAGNVSDALDANGEPEVTIKDGEPSFTSSIAMKAHRTKPANSYNFSSELDIGPSAMAETSEAPTSLYRGTTTSSKEPGFFSLRHYNEEDLLNGKKNISVRPSNSRSGIYKFGQHYFRVTNRGPMLIGQVKEGAARLRERSLGENDIQYDHIEEFYKGRMAMYIYDIKKLDEKDYAGASAMADFVGSMKAAGKRDALVVGNVTFDHYISATYDYISRLRDERNRLRGNLFLQDEYKQRIDAQEKILQQLRASASIRVLIESGLSQVASSQKHALKADASILELTEGMRIAKAWSELTDFLNFNKEGKTQIELDLIKTATKLQSDATELRSEIRKRIVKRMIAEGKKRGIDVASIVGTDNKFRVKDIGGFTSDTFSVNWSTNPLDQLLAAMITHSKAKRDSEGHAYMVEQDNKARELLGSASASDEFMEEIVESTEVVDGKRVTVRKRVIVTKYDRGFEEHYSALRKQAQRGEIEWSEFYAFENKHFEYELTQAGRDQYEAFIADTRKLHTVPDPDGTMKEDTETIEKIRKRFDPDLFARFLLAPGTPGKLTKPNAGGKFFTKKAKGVKLNAAYEKLTPQQKDYHTWFVQTVASHSVDSVYDHRMGDFDMDGLLMSFTHGAEKPGMLGHLTNTAIDWIQGIGTVVGENPKSKVTKRGLTGKKHIEAPFKSIINFLPTGRDKFYPRKVLTEWVKSSIAYKHKKEVEESINLINDIASEALLIEETNSRNVAQNRAGGASIVGTPVNFADRIKYTAESYLLDTGADPETTLNKKAPGERGFSLDRLLNQANTFTRLRSMAFSPLGAIGNLLMGVTNNLVMASSERYYNDAELLQATAMLKLSPVKFILDQVTGKRVTIASDRTKLIADIMYRYNIIGDVTEELVYGESAIAKLYSLQKGGEFLVQGASAIAQMLHEKVKFKDGSEKTFFDIYSLDENDRSKFNTDLLADDSPYRNEDNVINFIERIKLVNDRIHGDYRNALKGKKTPFKRMLFIFRTWLPMSVKERFGEEYEHKILGTQKGRYRSVWHLLQGAVYDPKTKKFFHDSKYKDLVKSFFKLIPFAGKLDILQFSDKISDVDRENINMFIREVQIKLALMTTIMLTKAFISKEDDDEEDSAGVGFMMYLYNQGGRLQQELSMFYSPSSFTYILQNVIPMSSMLVDVEKVMEAMYNYAKDPEDDIYESGFREGHSKLGTRIFKVVPVLRSYENTWSAFSQLYNDNRR